MVIAIENIFTINLPYFYDTIGWFGRTGLLIVENATGIIPSEFILGFTGWMLLQPLATTTLVPSTDSRWMRLVT